MDTVVFYLLALVTLGSGIGVVFLRRPIHNVLFMIISMIGLAGFLILLHAEFLGMVQLVVYAGAVMVLFLFVIMLLNLDQVRILEHSQAARRWFGVILALLLPAMIYPMLRALPAGAARAGEKVGIVSNTEAIARELFTKYLLPFELASVLLLAAIIGTVILARKKH
jgi:NADH-quinone oxidoreductase subunit J